MCNKNKTSLLCNGKSLFEITKMLMLVMFVLIIRKTLLNVEYDFTCVEDVTQTGIEK